MTRPISLDLSQKQTPSLKQVQRLMMSPQMQQALNLLQLPILELSALVETELEQNPILESSEEEDQELKQVESDIEEAQEEAPAPTEKELTFDERDFEILRQLDEDFKDHFSESSSYKNLRTTDDEKLANFLENSIRSSMTFFEYLMQQATETFSTEEELKIAESLIGSLDERGILQTPLEEIALLNGFHYDQISKVLKEIQKFDPPGIGAQGIQEALLLQLARQGKENSLAYKIVENHYQALLHNKIPQIQRQLGCSAESIAVAIEKDISKLDLHPGTEFCRHITQEIIPDIIVSQEDDSLIIKVTDDRLPLFRINSRYLKMMQDETVSKETKEFIVKKLVSAKWLMRNIYQRNDTLERISRYLVDKQTVFFLNPDGKLVPLTMKNVAEELEVHESTVARAIANKYLYCPRGMFPLRSFFTTTYVTDQGEDISSQTVKDVLQEIIDSEDKRKPLSDEQIAAVIKSKGIPCARRTVAKYRVLLRIGNTHQRKKY